MAHVLMEEEQDLFQPLGRVSSGMVVVQSGKRRLRVDGRIPVTPCTCFVPLPADVELVDQQGKEIIPKGKKKFFITISTINPHIVVEAWYLPMASTETES